MLVFTLTVAYECRIGDAPGREQDETPPFFLRHRGRAYWFDRNFYFLIGIARAYWNS